MPDTIHQLFKKENPVDGSLVVGEVQLFPQFERGILNFELIF
jgi:hypothetical protein